MIVAVLSVLCLFLFVCLACLGIFCYYLIRSNFVLQQQMDVYEDFIKRVSFILEVDVDFLRGSLAQKLSLNIPEVSELFSGLTRLKEDILQIRSAIDTFGIKK